MKKLTPGKTRGLQRCITKNGAVSILALDHRNNLRKSLNPGHPELVKFEDMVNFKSELVSALAPSASAVLLDPEAGAAQCISTGTLPPETGLLVAVDATGYLGPKHNRESVLLRGWSPEKAKKIGADAVKLLVYYHPEADNSQAIETLVAQTAEECAAQDILFVLEPLSYSPDPALPKLGSREKLKVVLQTAERLCAEGVDILKAEFPLDPTESPDESEWCEACASLSEASPVPWVLLSAGVSFETYLSQVSAACRAGASGIAAGRAVWSEAASLQGSKRRDFVTIVARRRLEKLTSLCEALARPVRELLVPVYPEEGWYTDYL